jgi:hypothetical protein
MIQLLTFVPKNCFFSNILLFTKISYNDKQYFQPQHSAYIKNKHEEFNFNNNNIKVNIEIYKLDNEHHLKIDSKYNILKNSLNYLIDEKININISTKNTLYENNLIINNIKNDYSLSIDNNNTYIISKSENIYTDFDIELHNHTNNNIKNIYTHYKKEIDLLYENQIIITG